MVEAILRAPPSFFDTTPSGILTNKFSNDLSLIDNSLIFGFTDSFEGPISIVIAIANMCQINFIFMIPAGIFFGVAIMFFFYSRPVIIKCKELDLQNKNPIFHFFG